MSATSQENKNPKNLNFYSFLERSGSHFIKENGENQKIRSLSSDFVIFVEKCRYAQERLITDINLLSFSGSTNFSMYNSSDFMTEEEGVNFYLHQHDFFELMFVLEGIVPVQIENELYQYRTNDICLINRSVKHVERFDSDCTVAFICLPVKLATEITTKLSEEKHAPLLSFFQENLSPDTMVSKNFLELRRDARHHLKPYAPRETLQQMMKELKEQYPGCVSIVQGLLFRFFYCLTEEHDYDAHFVHMDFSMSDYVFEQIHAYLVSTNGQVNRKELEQKFHYSANHLNKIVKQHSGMTLVEYGQAYRMKQAARLICTTETSIEKISQELGFENRGYFYRLFEKTYHMSPVAYRKYRKENPKT